MLAKGLNPRGYSPHSHEASAKGPASGKRLQKMLKARETEVSRVHCIFPEGCADTVASGSSECKFHLGTVPCIDNQIKTQSLHVA